jgi:hypothetical protein
MIAEYSVHRLNTIAMLPETRAILLRLIAEDEEMAPQSTQGMVLIKELYRLLSGGEERAIQPFAAAWAILYAALRRLDHLQDGDPPDSPLPPAPSPGAHYNLLFGYYLVGTALLDDLDTKTIPASRLLRLRRLWTDCLLVAASGQQRDLQRDNLQEQGLEALDDYQQIVQAKAGALFALAFGGTAILAMDDEATIAALATAGQVYGTLLQYSDDLWDAAVQTDPVATLPEAYRVACMSSGIHLPQHEVTAYWEHIYTVYMQQVDRLLAGLSSEVQTSIRRLFATTFEEGQESKAAS